MSITATVENDTITLPPGVHFPNGAAVRVELVDEPTAPQIEAWLQRARGAARGGITTDGIMAITRGEA